MKIKLSLAKLAKFTAVLWLICIAVFFALVVSFSASSKSISLNAWQASLVRYDFLSGVLFFCLAVFFSGLHLIARDRLLSFKKNTQRRCNTILALTLILVGFAAFSLGWPVLHSRDHEETNTPASAVPTNTPIPTLTPTITNTYNKQSTQVNTVVSCNVAAQCGGKIALKNGQSCNQITCCGFQNNKWSIYPSKSECIVAQQKEVDAINAQRVGDAVSYQRAINALHAISQSVQRSIQEMQDIDTQNQIDSQNFQNNIKQIGPTITLTQPTPIQSGVKCYDTWDEYLAAHPGYYGDVAGLGPNPPCD